jgi:hypothetical protein
VFTDILAKADKDPLNNGKTFSTLHNYAARDAEHQQLLREYGFPSEQPLEGMRYTPVVEVETNDWGIPINHKPPWTVNEAGQDLGDKLDEDSPDYSMSAAAKAKKAAEDSDHPWYSPEISITKQFLNYMDISKAETNPFAVATAQAKKQGHSGFKEGSAGDSQRKKIAEAIKRD